MKGSILDFSTFLNVFVNDSFHFISNYTCERANISAEELCPTIITKTHTFNLSLCLVKKWNDEKRASRLNILSRRSQGHAANASILRQMFDWRGELEVGREEVPGPGQHQFVRLPDSHVSNTYTEHTSFIYLVLWIRIQVGKMTHQNRKSS